MSWVGVFAIELKIDPARRIYAYDVSPSEAVQKFLKEFRRHNFTLDQIDTVKAEFKEIEVK